VTAEKPESQEICFVPGGDYREALRQRAGWVPEAGALLDGDDGEWVGEHGGTPGYTVGQRKGIGVAAAEPLYVLATDARANRVTVGPRTALATPVVAVRGARLHRAGAEVDAVKLRYRSTPVACRVAGDVGPGTHPRLELELADPVDGTAPGQTACLLRGDVVVGYGTISA
jgi:tRNA-specific 2-thiouridylase